MRGTLRLLTAGLILLAATGAALAAPADNKAEVGMAAATPKPMADVKSAIPKRGAASVQPAKRWEEAFVSGNGRMGAMVFGQPARETIVANHV